MTVFFILLAVLAAVLAGAYICYRMCFAVPRQVTLNPYDPPVGEQYQPLMDKIMRSIKTADEIPYEQVSITSHDGLKLYARYYHTADGAPVQIMFHGYRGNPMRDFSGGLPLALKSGCNALVVDQRAHGKSEGRCLSFGVLERYDVCSWVAYAAGRFGNVPIVLVGLSMGAATVMMSSDLDMPGNVVGIVADCGYSSPRAIIRKVMADIHYPGFLYPLVRLGGLVFGGFDIDAAAAETALAKTKLPVLFIHGEDDRFVPCDMSRACYAACTGPKQLVTVPAAGHGLAYMVGPDQYRDAVQSFVRHVTGTQ